MASSKRPGHFPRSFRAKPRVAHEAAPPRRRSKYNVDLSASGKERRTYAGQVYKSQAEVRYAQLLDLRQAAGEIAAWAYEPRRFPLLAFGPEGKPIKIGVYTPDFCVTFPDGSHEYVETKGRSTIDYRLRAKLFRACYPQEPWREVAAADIPAL